MTGGRDTAERTRCRICQTVLPPPFLDLGAMPLANAFLKSRDEVAAEKSYPLAVTACPDCGLVQLTYTVPADVLYRDYIYVSSTSDAVRAHAAALAERLTRRYGWGPEALMVEVASNDGTVLKAFAGTGVRVLGVEPAANIAALAEADGVPTVAEFFTDRTAGDVRRQYGEAKGILARHVFAHVDDVHDFLTGVGRLLADDGVLLIEVPYLGSLIEKLEFDTIYHEHLSYFALSPVDRLMRMHGFQLTDVEPVSLHGGSILMHVRRAGGAGRSSATFDAMMSAEQTNRLADAAHLAAFASAVVAWRSGFEAFVDGVTGAGARLIGYGAAAKANTLLNFCPSVARSLSCILDKSPHKYGRLTPGTHVPVAAAQDWERQDATHMLVLAWNFKDEIMRQMQPFAARGGRFVIPIPQPHVV